MAKWINHPWSVAVGASVLAAIFAELSPVRLLSRHVIPAILVGLQPLRTKTAVELWMLAAGPIAGGAAVLIMQRLSRWRRAKKLPSFAGARWQRVPEVDRVKPVCERCRRTMQPFVATEERTDSQGVPFSFTPPYPNAIQCEGCGRSVVFGRPWDTVRSDAQRALSPPL